MKNPALKFLTPAIAVACLGSLPNAAKAATDYFTTAITAGNTYSWDDANWSTSSTGPFTSDWVAANFAEFKSAASYTVTVNQSENNTGIYNDSSSSTITINDAGSGTGNLNVSGGIQGYLTLGTTIINVAITGTGGIAPESGGSLYLNAANTYTGGTALGDSGNNLTYFNNNNAFSTGGITLNRTGIANFSTLLGYGGSALTIANNFSITSAVGTGTALNFASSASTPVTSSGTWTLGSYNLNLRNSGGSTAPLTLSGAISGTGSLILSANGSGNTTIFSAINPFSGSVTLTGSGGTYGGSGAITLKLGVANALASSSQINLAGGTLDPGGFNQQFGALNLTASSTIDFEAGAATLSFADSSGLTWGSGDILDLADWTSGDELLFAGTGLTTAQLADIEFNGDTSTLGSASLVNGEIVEAPEPSTIALGLLGGLGIFLMRRKKD
ncbi:MAG TPA: PEP-CTERM sorting domain-containing protein [Verrucomicrobiae bacterium]|nr:PEP-CTERM sorting domain-containing protein [Verrucomicrobiae bacterium]